MSLDQAKIPLLGGLGNQLFQLAALLSLDAKLSILECSWGKARKTNNLEDIFHYKLESLVTRAETKEFQTLLHRCFNFMLRFQLGPAPKILKWSSSIIWELVISLMLKQSYSLRVSREVGFININPLGKKKILLHGYFQTYRYLDMPHVKSKLQALELQTPPSEFEQYKELSALERPLVVHVRRGDYQLEKDFGILGDRYYEESLINIWDPLKFGKIWLFSDEPDNALNAIPRTYREHIRVIPNLDLVPATTLEIMRLGRGYIIANSSFSWWAASLSRNENVQIIAPSKWFKGKKDPLELIPTHWKRVESNFP